MRSISSRKSDRVKELVRLHKKSERYASRQFFAEGPAVVSTALENSPELVIEVFATEEFADTYVDLGATVTLCSPEVISALARAQNPQGVVAMCRMPTVETSEIFARSGVVVVLDNIADPGNMGTIVRTADATNAAGVFTFGNCVDPFNDKVVRSSAGSIFRVPIGHIESISEIPKERAIFTLSADATVGISDVDLSAAQHVWVIGSEAHGVSADWLEHVSDLTPVHIPMAPGVESLNAAVAASVCLYLGYLQRTNL